MTVGHVGQESSGGHADGQKSAHTHAHAPNTFGTAFAIGTVVNTAFVIIEVVAGLAGNWQRVRNHLRWHDDLGAQ